MNYIITEKQYSRIIGEQGQILQQRPSNVSDNTRVATPIVKTKGTDPKLKSSYPDCLLNGEKEILKTPKGNYFLKVKHPSLENFQFYLNGRVLKPDGQTGSYYCGRENSSAIFIDGVDMQVKLKKDWNWGDPSTWNVDISTDTALTIAQLLTISMPLLSFGLGLAQARLYSQQGDNKTAGLIALFSTIPLLGPVAKSIGLGNLTQKAMGEIGKKVGLGSKLTPNEVQVVNKVAQYKKLIQDELSKNAGKIGVTAAKQNVKQGLKRQAVIQSAKNIGKPVAGYGAAGVAYSKGYDYLQRNTPKLKAEKLGLDWGFVRDTFGSSGSEEDNKLLNQAWDAGWRPGQIVPEKFQLQKYKDIYSEEQRKRDELENLLASLKGT